MMDPSRANRPPSYGTVEQQPAPPYQVYVYEQEGQYQPAPQTYPSAGAPTVQQPRAQQRREVWYSEGWFGRNYDIEQPEPGRMVISGYKKYGAVWYTYADELPCRYYSYLMCAVLLVILATPLSLVCTIPSLMWMSKAREEAERGNVMEARENYSYAKWSMAFAVMLFVLVLLGVGLGVGLPLASAGDS